MDKGTNRATCANQGSIQGARRIKTWQKLQKKRHSKLFSSKLWVTIWAIGMTSFIVIANRTDFLNIAQWLCAVPLAYIGCNVWAEKIYSDSEGK